MASDGLRGQYPNATFYPAYCYKASPTYFAWVKLTAFEIHNTLYTSRGFEGQNLFFYLNHPIQFVYLVGVVVSYEDFHERRWLLIIDDCSGATIEVTCPKPERRTDGERGKSTDEQLRPGATISAEELARDNTMASVEVGSVIKVKGKVGTFRDIRQIQLERIAIVPDTNAEMRFMEQRTKFKTEILSKPWSVSPEEQGRLLKLAEGREKSDRMQDRKRKEREAAREAREKKHEEKIAKRYEADDLKRETAAETARKAGEMFMMHRSRKRAKLTGGTNVGRIADS